MRACKAGTGELASSVGDEVLCNPAAPELVF